ncbi:unnamed protein product [Ectocarpus sp. CCAP 1310/34]|nr:unnamed protein product [Ectocarpus sp. CCAP 1310/34]
MATTLSGCWQWWPMRRARRSERETSRGVSRKVKSRFTTIRMPAQVSSAGPAGRGRPHSPSDGGGGEETSSVSCAALGAVAGLETDIIGESSGGAIGRHPSQQKEDGDSQSAAAVAVKVRKGGLFGVLRRPTFGGGADDDVVHVPAGEICVICMEPFQANDVLEVLLCQHLYHQRCIHEWLGSHTSCCVCMADMEEMARATKKPSRRHRRRSRARPATRSERSESLRSESGYSSDQARSTLSSMSAPAALADRLPADSGRSDRPQASSGPPPLPLPRTLQPRIGGTSHAGPSRTFHQPRGHRRAAGVGGRPGESRAAPVGRSPTPIPKSLRPNPRWPRNPRSPARRSNVVTRRRTAAASGFSSPPAVHIASPGPSGGGAAAAAASLNTRLTPVSEWTLQSGADGSRERQISGTSSSSSSSSSSGSFCGNTSSIDSSDGEDQLPSDRVAQLSKFGEKRPSGPYSHRHTPRSHHASSTFLSGRSSERSGRPAAQSSLSFRPSARSSRCPQRSGLLDRHPGVRHLSPAAVHDRAGAAEARPRSASGSSPLLLTRTEIVRPTSRAQGRASSTPSPRPPSEGTSAAAAAAAVATSPTASPPNGEQAVLQRVSAPESPRSGFPSAVATLSTPQRMRRKSYAQRATSFSVEDTLLLASSGLAASGSGTAPATPQRRWEASPSTPRNWPIMTSSAGNTPSRRHRRIRQRDSSPRRGVVGAGGPAAANRHGGEPGRRQSWGEQKQTEAEEEIHGGGVSGFSGRVPGEGAAARGYVRTKQEQPLGVGVRRAGGGRGRASAPLTESSPSGGVVLRRSWEERKYSTRDDEEEQEEKGKRRSSREKDDGVARLRGVAGFDVGVSTAGEPPPPPPPPGCDWDSPVPAAGGLDGRRSSATRAEEDRWPEDFLEKSPPSEPGSHKTCSTQWSEMDSQSQGSGNSYAGSTNSSSAMSAHPAGRRSVHSRSTTTSPRPHAPTIAEAKRPPPASSSPSLAVVVSTGGPKSGPEPCNPREDVSGGDTPNLLTPGALTPGALRARSESAPMIWD